MQAAILEDAMDEATKQSLQELATMSAKICDSGRTTNRKEQRWWKDRLKKIKQEVCSWNQRPRPRYVLWEDIRAEEESRVKMRGGDNVVKVVDELWLRALQCGRSHGY